MREMKWSFAADMFKASFLRTYYLFNWSHWTLLGLMESSVSVIHYWFGQSRSLSYQLLHYSLVFNVNPLCFLSLFREIEGSFHCCWAILHRIHMSLWLTLTHLYLIDSIEQVFIGSQNIMHALLFPILMAGGFMFLELLYSFFFSSPLLSALQMF